MALFDDLFGGAFSLGRSDSWLRDIAARNPDGSGNNRAHADWGVAGGLYARVTENSYGDGRGTVWDLPVQEAGGRNPASLVGDAPQPREITSRVMAQPTDGAGHDINLPNAAGVNEYFQFFGQFLTHDVAQAASGGGGGAPLLLDGLPFPFTRTPSELGSDAHNDLVRQQINNKSSFLDLSQVYGPSQAIENLLRAEAPGGGLSAEMLVGAGGMLPTFREVALDKDITLAQAVAAISPGSAETAYATGDGRANQQTPLLSHHMLWLRNHNWHVEQLREQFPNWNENRLFEAARALNEADWQHVVYSEYVARLVGEDALSAYSGYKADVDPSVINEWTTVAFRFGHDQSSNDLGLVAENGTVVDVMTLAESFQSKADSLRDDGALGDWVRGQLGRTTQEIDGKIVQGNRNLLFGNAFITDLSVLDIQRGRDHGVGRFNALREGLGLDAYDSFDDFGRRNGVDPDDIAALKDIYGNRIDRLDSLVGGLLEKHAPGSMLGETFTVLNVMQFEALRDGDRLFSLNRLSADLLDRVESVSLAEIVARNTEVGHVYRDAFLAHERIGGTGASDRLDGTTGRDLLIGFKGYDRLSGLSGEDDLYGDSGGDTLSGGKGNDAVYGGLDDDLCYGGAGTDFLDGGRGNDTLYGGTWDDFLFGGTGADRLHGDGGDDRLDGGPGADHLWGDDGRDVFVMSARAGRDVIHGFTSADRLDVSAFDFETIQELRAAATVSNGSTFIALGGEDMAVLGGVDWTLHSRHVIFDDPSV